MKKKIFLWIVWFLFLVWLYFYIFPIYKDFWIKDSYFETNHYDKEFNSEDNGYLDIENFLEFIDFGALSITIKYFNFLHIRWWVDKVRDDYREGKTFNFVINSLDFFEFSTQFDEEFLSRIDSYNVKKHHFLKNNLDEEFKKLETSFFSEDEKIVYSQYSQKFVELEEFLLDPSNFYKTKSFKKLLFISQKYSNFQQKALSKKYISSFLKGNELGKDYVSLVDLMLISRTLQYVWEYYIQQGRSQKWVEIFTTNNSFIIELLEKWDFKLIEVMLLRTLLNINLKNLDYIMENYNLSNENKDTIKQNLLSIDINNELYKNAFKREYQLASETLFDSFFWELEIQKVFLHKLFYSEKDTKNILRKGNYDLVENWSTNIQIKRNWRNFLWRILLQGWLDVDYISQYEKIDKLNALKQGILEKIEQ